MSEIDAAALRSKSDAGYRASWDDVFALLDALEKARVTTNQAILRMREAESKVTSSKGAATRARNDRTIAIGERDAARALLGEALPWVGHMSDNPDIGLRARIAAQLEPKP